MTGDDLLTMSLALTFLASMGHQDSLCFCPGIGKFVPMVILRLDATTRLAVSQKAYEAVSFLTGSPAVTIGQYFKCKGALHGLLVFPRVGDRYRTYYGFDGIVYSIV